MTNNVTKHFVHFLSPGSFVHEQTMKPIDSWDVSKAKAMAHKVIERHGATPFAFYFSTRKRGPLDLDSTEVKRSGNYYLGGEVLTLSKVEAQNDPGNQILVSNMRINHWDKIVINRNSWKIAQPLLKNDTVLEWKPNGKEELPRRGGRSRRRR